MATGATGQLGLALPVQGELSGTWGDTVNNGITQYTNIAIAGTLTLTGDGAVTLANTTGDASASNITSTLAGAGTVTAQFAIVQVSGTTTTKVVTGPSYSKTYVVDNASSYAVTFKASGQTGVSIAAAEKVTVVFNGTDYIKLAGTIANAAGSNTQIQFNNGGLFGASSSLTWDGTTLSSTQVNITGQGTLRLQDTTGGEYVGLRAPASLGASYTLTWPADDGTNGQALVTDGSGVLSWSTAASGDVYGPGSSTDNAVARFDGTTGKLLQNGVVLIGDTGAVTGVTDLTASGSVTLSGSTANGVFYSNGSKVLTSGSALTFDGTKLGVGTASPLVGGLVTIGDGSTNASQYLNGGSTGGGLIGRISGSNTWIVGDTASALGSGTGLINYVYGNNPTIWYNNSSEQMRLTSTGLGIGTSSPTNKLTVDGNANITGNVTLGDASTDTVTVYGKMGFGAAPSTNTGIYYRATASQITGSTSGYGLYMDVPFASDVTSSAEAARFRVNTAAASFTVTSATGLRVLNATNGAGSTITNLFGLYIDDLTSGTNNYGITSAVSSGTNKWNIYASGTADNYFAGNVAINTTDTTITGSVVGASSRFVVSGSVGRTQLANTGNEIAFSRNAANYISANGGTSAGIITGAQLYLRFDTGSTLTERMRIDSSGNVGIGTSSPAVKLDVANASGRAARIGGFQFGGTSSTADAGNNLLSSGAFWNGTNFTATQTTAATIQLGNGAINFYTESGLTPTGTYTGNVKATLDSAGNLGLGVTPSAWNAYKAIQVNEASLAATTGSNTALTSNGYFDGTNWKYIYSNYATRYLMSSGAHSWSIAASGSSGANISFTQAMTLDASGNLGVGTTSPALAGYNKEISVSAGTSGTARAGINIQGSRTTDSTFGALTFFHQANNVGSIEMIRGGADNSGVMQFFTANSGTIAERARIGSTGRFEVSYSTNNGSQAAIFTNSAATAGNQYGLGVTLSSDPNGASNYFLQCLGNATNRTTILANGGIQNYSANNSNLSDRREKTNFAPAASYLDKICAIPVQTFNYIDQNLETDAGLTLGVVAQDVQAVAPELVTETNWGTQEEPKMRLSIYQTDLQYALMKALQEQQAIIESLKARLDAANL
jgi:hypothetical protein